MKFETGHTLDPVCPNSIRNLSAVVLRDRHWLFDKKMLTRARRERRQWRMRIVIGADINRFDLIRMNGILCTICRAPGITRGEPFCAPSIFIGKQHRRISELSKHVGMCFTDQPTAQDRDFEHFRFKNTEKTLPELGSRDRPNIHGTILGTNEGLGSLPDEYGPKFHTRDRPAWQKFLHRYEWEAGRAR